MLRWSHAERMKMEGSMVSDEAMAEIRSMIEEGLIECWCEVCQQGVPDENLESLQAHKERTGHRPVLARRNGAVLRQLTPKGRREAERIVDRLEP